MHTWNGVERAVETLESLIIAKAESLRKKTLLDWISFNSMRKQYDKTMRKTNREKLFKKSLEGKLGNKIQPAVSGTESTVKTNTRKLTKRKLVSGPWLQNKKKAR